MHTRIFIVSLILALCTFTVQGQDSLLYTSKVPDDIIGTWYLRGSFSEDTLAFQKESIAPFNHGPRIEIHENGDFVDAYSAGCGNDSKLHYDKGRWKIDLLSMIFTTTIPIDYRAMVYKIEQIAENRLVLVEVK